MNLRAEYKYHESEILNNEDSIILYFPSPTMIYEHYKLINIDCSHKIIYITGGDFL